jgi:hypothetical protein
MDDDMIRRARTNVVEAALEWYVELQHQPDRVLTQAEEKLRVAVMMYRKTRSASGQLNVNDVREALREASDKK